ncbi:hypothetical protein VNO80_25860 [Phaseolus coccineus]|uniref:Retrovirus-related Pol polyprotein from transposon TNT 1-94 n=1 Tax=Phaseolus coccineus TaxID=3886 RepID=A0AAN9QPD7_PHACN
MAQKCNTGGSTVIHPRRIPIKLDAEMGESVSEQEHIEAILEGLPEEYDAMAYVICTRDNPSITLAESLLLLNEAEIQKQKIPGHGSSRFS